MITASLSKSLIFFAFRKNNKTVRMMAKTTPIPHTTSRLMLELMNTLSLILLSSTWLLRSSWVLILLSPTMVESEKSNKFLVIRTTKFKRFNKCGLRK